MSKIRKTLLSFSKGILQWRERPRISGAFLTTAVLCALCGGVYIAQVGRAGETLGVAEPFLAMTCDFRLMLLVMVAQLLINMDAPFFDSNDALLIFRIGRDNWMWGRIAYIAVAGFLLPYALAAVSSLLLSPFTFFYNEWSPAAVALSQDSFVYYNPSLSGHYFPPVIGWNIISTMKPFAALLWACGLLGLFNATLTMWMMGISMSYNRIIGTATAIAVVLVGPAIQYGQRWNPYINGLLSLHQLTNSYLTADGPALLFSVFYFLALLVAGVAFMTYRTMRHSFKWGE